MLFPRMLASVPASIKSVWQETIDKLGAHTRLKKPFWNARDWPMSYEKEDEEEEEDEEDNRHPIARYIETYAKSRECADDCKHATRVFYLANYFEHAATSLSSSHAYANPVEDIDKWVFRMLTRVPFVYTNRGELQDGTKFASWDSKPLQRGIDKYDLISYEERILARRKVICTPVRILGVGGYPHSPEQQQQVRLLLESPKKCIMLSVIGPQMDAPPLDTKYFVKQDYAGTYYFDEELYLKSIMHDVYLWLVSFDQMVQIQQQQQGDERKGLLHLCRVGAGFFAQVREIDANVGDQVAACIVAALEYILTHVSFAHIGVIDLLWFDVKRLFKGKKQIKLGGITLRSTQKDALDFSNADYKKYHCGVTNGSDAWSVPGNEMGYESLEAMIGNNTTMRVNQVYHWNPHLLNSKNYIPVQLPSDLFGHTLYACNGKEEFQGEMNQVNSFVDAYFS